jgi:hypothetical protein
MLIVSYLQMAHRCGSLDIFSAHTCMLLSAVIGNNQGIKDKR